VVSSVVKGKIQVKMSSTKADNGYFEAMSRITWFPPEDKIKIKQPTLKIPEIVEVFEKDWNTGNGINDERDVSFLLITGNTKTLFVNMNSKILLDKLKKTQDKYIDLEKSSWKMACLLLWIPYYGDNLQEDPDLDPEKIKKVLNNSFMGIFPLLEVAKTMYLNKSDILGDS